MAFNPNDHLMSLKGKDYLQVMWRLVWFREEKPLWCINTKIEQLTEDHAVFSAQIMDENGIQKASGFGSESINDFHDFIEKAETKAIGRALAMLGYGTQFAPELDEEDRIVDSPVDRSSVNRSANPSNICPICGGGITRAEIDYSTLKFGKVACRSCQQKMNKKEGVKND